MSKPILVVTPGDPDGIGPEVVWKAILSKHAEWCDSFSLLCVGAKKPFERLGAKIRIVDSSMTQPEDSEPHVWLWETPTKVDSPLLLEGYQSGWAIEKAASLVSQKIGAALITGPIHKDRLQKGGYHFFGHTDFLASLTQTPKVTMMLANSHARVTLVTTHIPIHVVSQKISHEAVFETIKQTVDGLRRFWGIANPNVAVLGLNPHAGENGILGNEENTVIAPAIKAAQISLHAKGVSGPYPADTFFGVVAKKSRFDAVVCMYHDQGLIPVKLLDFENTVNVTLGLPFIRTSVDHGTAFDIAWKNEANCSSFIAATELAFDLWRNHGKI